MIYCSHTKVEKLSNLKPHPDNENVHSEKQIEVLAKVINKNGQRSPIVVSKRSGYITKGHGRLAALIKLGWDECAIDEQEYASEIDEVNDRIADNTIASYSEFQNDKMLDNLKDLGIDFDDLDFEELGLIDFEMPNLEVLEPQSDEDSVPEIQPDPITKRGDVWLLGNHRVLCGDSTMIDDVEKLTKGEFIDLNLSDPPYGISIVNAKTKKVGAENLAKNQEYAEVIGDDSTETAREYYHCVSTFAKEHIIWGGNYFTDFLDPSPCWIVWDKRGDMNSNDFADGEMAWCSRSSPVRIYKQIWNGMIREGESQKRVHPTQKPVALMEFCIDSVKECKTVIDGFLGSGSTLIACESKNKHCYGMELSEQYVDVVIKRWQEYTGKEATLESTGEKWQDLQNTK